MATRYLYFNKTAFRHLIKVWRKVCYNDKLLHWTDEHLMLSFIPDKFISDIEEALNNDTH